MILDSENLMEWAEQYVLRTLTAKELMAINQQLRADAKLKLEWHHAIQLAKELNQAQSFFEAQRQAQSLSKHWKNQSKLPNQEETTSRYKKLWKKYGRTGSIAASVAIVASTITFFMATNSNKIHNQNQFVSLKRDVENIKTSQRELKETIDETEKNTAPIENQNITGNVIGTGFAIANNGYLATDYHVVENADSIYVQTHDGKYHKAFVVGFNEDHDIAVLKVSNSKFKFSKADIPYGIANADAGLAQSIYSLGFPQDDAMYSEGYISSQKGLAGDEHSYQLDLPAYPGQSGSPIFDKNGNVIGMIIGKKTFSTYATKSQVLLDLIKTLPKDFNIKPNNTNSNKNLNRQDQVNKSLDFVCAVRVYKR